LIAYSSREDLEGSRRSPKVVRLLFDSVTIITSLNIIVTSLLISRGMASVADNAASRAARFTEQTRSMFRAILAENGIADTDNTILQQEMVMFFKLGKWHLWAIRFELTVFSPFTSN
jgi:hypothetical protein